jgi:hypothetical protein
MSEDGTYAKILHVAAADRWGGEKVRAITKWWLDLMRNVVVVSVLLYLARKSDGWPLTIVAYASFGALVLYCLTYTAWWFFNPLHQFGGRSWWIRMLTYQMANLVSLASFWFVWIALTRAVDAVSKAQGS